MKVWFSTSETALTKDMLYGAHTDPGRFGVGRVVKLAGDVAVLEFPPAAVAGIGLRRVAGGLQGDLIEGSARMLVVVDGPVAVAEGDDPYLQASVISVGAVS